MAPKVTNELNEQGSMGPKATDDHCELRGAAQRARGAGEEVFAGMWAGRNAMDAPNRFAR